ncbi:TPA: hypothetical protein QCY71_005534 [Bacillus cereus]|nr:hypothetical protein [Bacillus cereus]
MKIHLIIFISTVKKNKENVPGLMMKTFESTILPSIGDIIHDPGFDSEFHNGYEVVKVTINYASNECYVSLTPLVLKREKMKVETYIEKLKTHGWRSVSRKEAQNM